MSQSFAFSRMVVIRRFLLPVSSFRLVFRGFSDVAKGIDEKLLKNLVCPLSKEPLR